MVLDANDIELDINKKGIETFYWINTSGLLYFKWVGHSSKNKKWCQEDDFLSGFLSAINSSAQVFFNSPNVPYIEMYQYKIYISSLRNRDLLVIITKLSFPDLMAKFLLRNLVNHYYDLDIQEEYVTGEDKPEIRDTFVKYANEAVLMDPGLILKQSKMLDENSCRDVELDEGESMKVIEFLDSELSDKDREFIGLFNANKKLESKIQTLTNLSRTVGHTYNNLLATILGNVSLMKYDVKVDTEMSSSLNDIETSCMRAKDLSIQLLSIAKTLNQITDETVDQFKDVNLVKNIGNTYYDGVVKPGVVGDMESEIDFPTVIVADDNPDLRDIVMKLVHRLGYRVYLAGTAEELLQKYEKFYKNTTKLVVILDYTINSTVDYEGKQTISKLKDIDPKVKAIISSGYIENPIFENFQEKGFIAAMKKPFTSTRLKEILDNYLKY